MYGYRARIAAILVLITANAWGEDRPAKKQSLEPDLKRSFATPTGSVFRVSLVGKDWALVAEFEAEDFPLADAKLPLERSIKPAKATFYAGPSVGDYVKPPAGPPARPIPTTGKYSATPIKDLSADLVAKERQREPDGHVFVKLSAFKIGDKEFAATSEIKLPLRGPNP